MRVISWKKGAAAFALVCAVAGCGSVGSGSDDSGTEDGPVTVGLVIPQSGVYAPLGEDMQDGWDLFLEQNGGKLGGREVKTVTVDEGEGPDTGVPAVQGQLRGNADIVVGIVNSATALGVTGAVNSAKKLLVIANAGAGDITQPDNKYIWRTSFTNEQVGFATGKYLAGTPEGKKSGAYAISPDYAGGTEAVGGFKSAFQVGGGEIVGEATTPFGTTQDFQPYLAKIRAAKPGAVFAFYAGAEAVSFVQQYKEFGLDKVAPLYGSGFLTEGSVLDAQGGAANGVFSALHYATSVENPTNAKFAADYERAAGRPATVYSVQAYDAASVIDKALTAAKSTSGDDLAAALDGLGEIEDSPRGPWSFKDRSPEQQMYLREVRDGANEVVEEMGDFPPRP